MSSAVFYFKTKLGTTPEIDEANFTIKGVTVITSGVTAKGHDLEVDNKTVSQIVECGTAAGKVQMKYDHKSGVTAIGGYLTNFRIEDGKGKADLVLLEKHEETKKTLEKAKKMPECFGLSAAFAGPKEGEMVGKKKCARCTELIAVDCVANPAANPTGLFSAAEVDISGVENPTNMDPELKAFLDGLKKDITDGLKTLSERMDKLEAGDQPLTQEDLENLLTDDKALLAEMEKEGIAADQIETIRGQLQATYDATYGDAAPGDTAADAAAAAASKAGTPVATVAQATQAATTAALNAIRPFIISLKRRDQQAIELAETEKVEGFFEVLEEKVTELSAINEQQATRIIALEAQLKRTGGRAAAPSAESLRLFSAQEGEEGVLEFETLCTKEFEALQKADPKLTEFAAKGKAQRTVINKHPEAYEEYLRKIGVAK